MLGSADARAWARVARALATPLMRECMYYILLVGHTNGMS